MNMAMNTKCSAPVTGRHKDSKAEAECPVHGLRPPSSIKSNSTISSAPMSLARTRSRTLGELSEASAGGSLSDDELFSDPALAKLEGDEREVLRDLISADNSYSFKEASGEDLALYVQDAYTGYESLNEWATDQMETFGDQVDAEETTDSYANSALLNEIWILPKREGDKEDYWVMNRAEAL